MIMCCRCPCLHNILTMKTETSATDMSVDGAVLPKKDRKKLKKLRKRASQVQTDGERSGLLTTAEWLEFQRLDKSAASSVGPSVQRRSRKEGVKIEGTHHRDLLAWCVRQAVQPSNPSQSIQQRPQQQSKKSRKRSRNDNGTEEQDLIFDPSIPSWASIHNSGALEGVAVLEVHVSSTESVESLADLVSAQFSNTTTGRKSHVTVPTNWFQGNTPRSISESLLYFVANKAKRTKHHDENQIPPTDALLNQLGDLIIPQDELSRENYPKPKEDSSSLTQKDEGFHQSSDVPASTEIQSPDSISLDDATKQVEQLGFQVYNPKGEDQQLYVSTHQPSDASKNTNSKPRVIGMDCEMVRTSEGPELARVTLV